MTNVKTLPAANYSADQVTLIVAMYKDGKDLETIAKTVSKSVPSVRAKLAALKVYVSKAKSDGKTSDKQTKENKDGLKSKLESLLGVELLNIESASKIALLALINHINQLNDKINQLVDDMLGDDSASDDMLGDDSASE